MATHQSYVSPGLPPHWMYTKPVWQPDNWICPTLFLSMPRNQLGICHNRGNILKSTSGASVAECGWAQTDEARRGSKHYLEQYTFQSWEVAAPDQSLASDRVKNTMALVSNQIIHTARHCVRGKPSDAAKQFPRYLTHWDTTYSHNMCPHNKGRMRSLALVCVSERWRLKWTC